MGHYRALIASCFFFVFSSAIAATFFEAHLPKQGEHVLTWTYEKEQKNWGPNLTQQIELKCPREQSIRQEWINSRTFKAWLTPGLRPGDGCTVRLNKEQEEKFVAEKITITDVAPYGLNYISEDSAIRISADSPVNMERFLQHSYLSVDGIEEKIDFELVPDSIVILLEEAYPYYRSETTVPLAIAKKDFWIHPKRTLPSSRRVKLVVEEDECYAFNVEGVTRPAFNLQVNCSRTQETENCSPISAIDIYLTSSVDQRFAKEIKLKVGSEFRLPKIDSESDSVNRLRFPPPFPENSKVELLIPEGMSDIDGRDLENKHNFPLAISLAAAPALAKFNGTFGILEAKTDARYPLSIRNVENPFNVDIAAYKVDLSQGIDQFIHWQGQLPDNRNYDYDENSGPNAKYATSLLSKNELAKAQHFKIKSTVGKGEIEMVGIPLPGPALYLLEFASPKLGKQYLQSGTFYNSSLVLVTNLAAHLKLGQDNTLVWVTELDSGQVRAGAKVTLYDCNGVKLESAITNTHGVALFKANRSSYTICASKVSSNPSQVLYAVASFNGDSTLVKSNWSEGLENWRFQLPYYSEYQGIEYHLVFDRPVYQKGEKVSFLGLARDVRPNKLTYPTSPLKSRIKIVHVGSEQTWYQNIKWDKWGSFATSFQIGKDFANGRYSIYLTQDQGNNKKNQDPGEYLGAFELQSFQLPYTELKTFWKEDKLSGIMTYLSGGVAIEIPVTARGVVEPTSLQSEDFPDVNFAQGGIEIIEEKTQVQELAKQETKSNVQGEIEFSFGNILRKDYIQQLSLELEFLDANGQYQINNNYKFIYPSMHLVGIKDVPYEDDKYKIYLIDNNKKILVNKEVSANLVHKITRSVRKKIIGGFYSYDNQVEYKDYGKVCQGKTNHRGIFLCQIKTPEAIGQYFLVAEAIDESGNKSKSATTFWKYGNDYWAGAQANDRVDFLTDKTKYQIGDKAKLELQIPFEKSTVLLTRERNGILDYQIVNMGRERPIIPFAIKETDAPNVYVSAFAVRGRLDSAAPIGQIDLGKPGMKLGLQEIKVAPAKKDVDFFISTDKNVYQIREVAKAMIDVPDKRKAETRFAVAVIDSGLLKIAGHSSFEMENVFKQMFEHDVQTASALSMVVGKRHFGLKARPHGGGGGAIKREFFESLLYWSPQLSANAQGKVPFQFKINDSLTEFTIFVLAYNEDTFTLKTHQIKSTQDILTFAGISNYLRFNDQSAVRMTLKNTTNKNFEIKADYSNSIGQKEEKKINLAANATETLSFDFKAPSEVAIIGHELKIFANGKVVDQLKMKQEIIPILNEKAFAADLRELSNKLNVALPQDPQLSSVQVSFSRNVLPASAPIKNFMANYAYSCLEQQIAKAVVLSGIHLKQLFTNLPRHLANGNLLSFYPDNKNFPSLWLTLHLLETSHWAKFQLPFEIENKIGQGLLNVLEKGYYKYYNYEVPLTNLDKVKIKALLQLRKSPLFKKEWAEEEIHPEELGLTELQYQLMIRPGDAHISKAIMQRYQLKGAIYNLIWGQKDASLDYAYGQENIVAQIRLLLLAQNNMWDTNGQKFYQSEQSKFWQGLTQSYRDTWQDSTVLSSYMMALINSVGEQGKISGKTVVGNQIALWGKSLPENIKLLVQEPRENLQIYHQGIGTPYINLRYFKIPLLEEKISRGFEITSLTSINDGVKAGERLKREWKVEVKDKASMTVLNIPIPAGARVIDSNVDAWYLYRELDDRNLKFYFDSNEPGAFKVMVNFIFDRPGKYQVPGPSIEEMYSPDRVAIEKGELIAVH